MTDAPLSRQDMDDALAAEYVLGVLALPERLSVEDWGRLTRAVHG